MPTKTDLREKQIRISAQLDAAHEQVVTYQRLLNDALENESRLETALQLAESERPI